MDHDLTIEDDVPVSAEAMYRTLAQHKADPPPREPTGVVPPMVSAVPGSPTLRSMGRVSGSKHKHGDGKGHYSGH